MMQLLFVLTLGLFSTAETAVQPNEKAKLEITVLDDLGKIMNEADVTVYRTKEDYQAGENPLITGKTDDKGVIQFKDLEVAVYFVDVRKDKKNNAGMGVQTKMLVKNKKNKVTIVISG